jgi:uncharacterized protein
MSRSLSSDSSLDVLKKEAKRWLKALKSGDAQARQRLAAATGSNPTEAGLRDVQLALAREYGLPGWTDLRRALDELAIARRSHAERVDIVLRAANWNGDHVGAGRILDRWPEIGTDNLYAAVATGNLREVERRLALNPAIARRPGGPLNWEPLLYLAHSRLPGYHEQSVAIAVLLLDHGADPNARWVDDWNNPFTVLTGVIGEGEGDVLPHDHAAQLASLLIERGADPFDTQAMYNTSIRRDDTKWLSILWRHCEQRGKLPCWMQVHPGLGAASHNSALNYLLGNAVSYNHLQRAEWLLTHGANPNAMHAYSRRPVREEALVYGHVSMAQLLERHGATTASLQGHASFQAACMRLDRRAARTLAAAHPEYLLNAAPMLFAARANRADVVALLLELGMNVDVADGTLQRGLHNAAASGAIEVAKLLIAHGADIDRPTTRYGGAMGFAAHFAQREIAAFLAPLSRDVWNLTHLGMKERLRELFAADPALVNAAHPKLSYTPLFALPDDEDEAADMATFLLAHGGDPTVRNRDGLTPEQVARQRGLIEAADLIRAAEA